MSEQQTSKLIEQINEHLAKQPYIKRWREEFLGERDVLDVVVIDHEWHKEYEGTPYVSLDTDGDLEFYVLGRSMGWGASWHSLILKEDIQDKPINEIMEMVDNLIFVRFDLPEKTVPMPPTQYKVPYKLIKQCRWIGDILKNMQDWLNDNV